MDNKNFQTPKEICTYMTNMISGRSNKILEPTKGAGNLLGALLPFGDIVAPDDFFLLPKQRFDWIVMNPPFTPMKLGYQILSDCMEMSDNIIALMPWLTLINSQKRTSKLKDFGIVSVTHLPRNVFSGSRVQTCIIHLMKGFNGSTEFIIY